VPTHSIDARPLIVLYNSAWGRWPDVEGTGCEVSTDRGRLRDAAAVVFHIPTLTPADRPIKYPGQRWVAWSMESDVVYPALASPRFMRVFDLTMTYRRDSSVWCPYFDAATAEDLLRPPQPKTAAAPAVLLQSSPYNQSDRVRYAAELMKRVKVHSYGAVLRNQPWPIDDTGHAAKLGLIGRHKFTLAFENSIAIDYVTEKLYDALVAGSVPVYLGAPNVRDLAPADDCFIDVAGFAGPSALAEYLNHLATDDAAYAGYLAWKTRGLSPRFLRLVDEVRRSPLQRLCALLAERGPSDGGPGRPSRPLGRPWPPIVRRLLSRLRRATRR
jgi:alpha-1,3-fucosyltransferase 10